MRDCHDRAAAATLSTLWQEAAFVKRAKSGHELQHAGDWVVAAYRAPHAAIRHPAAVHARDHLQLRPADRAADERRSINLTAGLQEGGRRALVAQRGARSPAGA
jgi:hypothetical protein